MLEIIGWLGSGLLLICSVPQAIRTVREGHCEGLSASMLWMWLGGMALMLVYLIPLGVWPPVASHCFNILLAGTMAWYKHFPRKL